MSPTINPHIAHRTGLATQVKRVAPETTLFARIGGRSTVEKIIDGLYDRIETDPQLKPMFHRDLNQERGKQKKFFEEWLGGEPLYSFHEAQSGLGRIHQRLSIGTTDAAQWLGHFQNSMKETGVDANLRREVLATLRPIAKAFVNYEEKNGLSLKERHAHGADWAFDRAVKAARKGETAAVAKALADNPDHLNFGDWRRPTLLYNAAERGRVEIIRLLVKKGANPNLPSHVDWQAGLETPLCGALRKRKKEAVEILQKHGARNDIFTQAALGNRSGVEEWLAKDPKLINEPDPADDFYRLTPVYHAVFAGHADVAALLLNKGAEPGLLSHQLVGWAAERDDLELVQKLLERGANATRIGVGRWVLNKELAQMLSKHGADVNYAPNPNASWLWQCCTGNHNQKDDPEYVRAVIDHGADVNAIHDYWGRAALHFAAKAGFVKTVNVLLKAGADPNLPDAKEGETPLFHALKAGKRIDPRPAVKALLKGGADVAVRNLRGQTVIEKHPNAGKMLRR